MRIGIIGLGRLWEARHKPALARNPGRFQVTAVYDQVARRAAIEAAQLGCSAVDGLRALIGHPEVDAVYLLAPQWFGLHALELACEAGKPVYCALPLASDLDSLLSVADKVRSSGVPFMPEVARRYYPATIRLRELLATTLGPPRLVLGHTRLTGYDRYGPPGPTSQVVPAPLAVDPGGNLLDWCRFLFGREPSSIQGFGSVVQPLDSSPARGEQADYDFEGFNLGFPGGGAAQITLTRYHRAAWGEAARFLPQPGFQVFAERGAAWLEMPDRISWTDAHSIHEERLPPEPSVGDTLNDQFYRLVRDGNPSAPTFEDAIAIARLVAEIRGTRPGASERPSPPPS